MKFVLLTLDYPPQHGGVATYYGGMVAELQRQGHEIIVVQTGLLSRYVFPHWLLGIVTLWKLLRREKPDFIVVGQILPLGTIAYLFRKRVPYIVVAHGMDLTLAKNFARKQYLAKKILANAHHVVANSNFTAGLAKSFGVLESKVSVLYPCPQELPTIDSETIEPLRAQLALSGKRVIVAVGRLVARKGFDTLITALPEILKKIPNAVLVIAGDGPMRETLAKQAVEMGVQGSVRIVGAIDSAMLTALYQMADVFAMPSRAIGGDVEGFGIVYLEAAQFGVPSVAGASGGSAEAVIHGKTGLVVNPISEDVAQAITQLLSQDEMRTTLGAAAKEFATTFSWQRNVDEFLKVI